MTESQVRWYSLEAVLLAVAFAVAHTQSPLYYSNQNQYLLHGAALANHRHLANDWLANTTDPTPLFSVMVAGVYRVHEWLLQPLYFALLMSYFLGVRWLVASIPQFPQTRCARIVFAAIFTATHAAFFRWLSVQAVGVDYPWYLQSGLAAQYLLGPGLQPSAFGVLLVFAVAAFAHNLPFRACALAAFACWFHSTYFLPSALLVCGFLVANWQSRSLRHTLRLAVFTLLVVLPPVVYSFAKFAPFDANTARAAELLADVRIPHHANISRWFDLVAGVQLAWIAVGLLLLRRLPVGRVLIVAGALAVILTLCVQPGTHKFALMFPWRLSVLLVPVATALIAARAVAWCAPRLRAERAAIVALVAFSASGLIVSFGQLGYRMVYEDELYAYVRANAKPQDVYLIPTAFPNVKAGRGAVSNTFAPPPRAKEGTNQIPVDLQRFRLATGAAIYVDFKSVPYAAAEVEEWYARMQFAAEVTKTANWNAPGMRDELRRRGITHIVSPRTKPIATDYAHEVHRDTNYFVYRVE
jgi:hypothetical protein